MRKVKPGAGFLIAVFLPLMMLCPIQAEEDMTSSQADPSGLSHVYPGDGSAGTQETREKVIQGNAPCEDNTENATRIVGSVKGNLGIVSLNQASGNMNNQSNLRVFSLGSSVQEIQMKRVIGLGSDEVYSIGGPRQNLIEASFQNNSGIMGINQSAGSLNSQSNTLIMAVGGLVSIAEAELDDVSASNLLREEAGAREDIIRDSFSNSRGIVQVTQSAGDMNIQANNLAFSFREIHLK